ncbi:TIGR02444 family protein [Pseudomonas sp.]|uniref:TIGR02444 family protein n=1 Tax=Pseudomonas sp. TaxID=306 RepID=UPI003C753F11
MPADLWRFAEAFYQRPEVEPVCLQLQAQGADVCLLICAVWLEVRQVACDDVRTAALADLARPWQCDVVQPLRHTRQAWRALAQSDSALALLRERLKQLELLAEREQLERLAELSRDWPNAAAAEPVDWLERLAPVAAERAALHILRSAATQLATN